MEKVYTSPNSVLVHNVKNVLSNQGIECEVRGDVRAGAMGGFPPGESWTELWVLDDASVALAREILDRSTSPDAREAWTCVVCGEVCEPPFTDCWKCGTERPEL